MNQNNPNPVDDKGGVDLRMTLLPEKLRQAGYRTAMTGELKSHIPEARATYTCLYFLHAGKWHSGARSMDNLPINRGFDYHLGFLTGGEDHYNQNCAPGNNRVLVDLWENHGPAYSKNG